MTNFDRAYAVAAAQESTDVKVAEQATKAAKSAKVQRNQFSKIKATNHMKQTMAS